MNDFLRKCKTLVFVVAGIALSFFSSTWGDDISLSARLSRTEMPFQSTVDLNLEVKWQGGIGKYAFEILPMPTTHGLKPLGTTSSISSLVENGMDYTVRTFKYTFTPTTGGTGVIEPIVLRYVAMPDSIPGELTSQQFQIAVAQPLPPKKKSQLPVIMISFAAVVILAAGVVALVTVRKRNRIPKEPVRTPEEIFLENLTAAKEESQSERKLFFTRLYKILIGYMERKYGITGGGKATSDLLSEIGRAEIPLSAKEQLSEWLVRADKEKYAPSGGAPGDIIRLITELESFFNRKQ